MSYTKIAAVFADSEALAGQTVTVGGWVRTIRDLKGFGFIELNDGSCFKNLQVVMESAALENYREIAAQNVGAALVVTGAVVLTPEAKQPLEVKAASIEVEGSSTPMALAAFTASSSELMVIKSMPQYCFTASCMGIRGQPGVRSMSSPCHWT